MIKVSWVDWGHVCGNVCGEGG